MQTSNLVLDDKALANLDSALNTELSGRGKWRKASDSIIACGVDSSMLVKPARGEENPYAKLHGQIEARIVSHFSAHVQSILPKEPKVLSDVDKETRRYWVKQIGSLFNVIRKHVIAAEAEPVTKTPKVAKTKVQRARGKIGEAIELVQAIDAPTFDVAAYVKEQKALMEKYLPKV